MSKTLISRQAKQEIIDQLKIVRKVRGLSYQDIVEATEAIGKPVSISSVKRVFAGNSGADCRYDTTIQPIAVVVLGIGEETEPPDSDDDAQNEKYFAQIEAMKTVIEAKNDIVEKSNAEIEALRAQIVRRNKFDLFLLLVLALLAASVLVLVIFK